VSDTLFVPTERARQMWPNEIPACQIVEGGIIVDAKTVAFAAQELMHKVFEQSQAENARLRQALSQYGKHRAHCAFHHRQKCNCGFDAILEAVAAPRPPSDSGVFSA